MKSTGAGGIVSPRGRKKRNTTTEFKENMKFLSQHFNPVAFPPPGKRLDISAHECLLKRIGLWDFVNLDFDETIREDLIKELVLCYKYYKRTYIGTSRVNGVGISLSRTSMEDALRLPARRAAKGSKGRHIWVSKEEGEFLEELIWGVLVLRDGGDDSSLMSHPFVVEFAEVLEEMRFESADWAGLVAFMVRRELSRGVDLANCYYAPHLQLVLKHQVPELFGDDNVESGLSASIRTKCFKRDKELLDAGVVGTDDEGKKLRKLQLGNDDQLVEDGNLEGVCQSDTVDDSLENKEKFSLNLKGNLSPEFRSNDCNISVTEPGSSRSHTSNPLMSGVEIAELEGILRDDYVGIEGMQVTQGHFQNVYVEERKNEGVMDLDSEGLMLVSCQKENAAMEGEATEASVGKSVKEAEAGVMEVKENEAAFKSNGGNSLDVLGVKEDVMEDKENEAKISDSLKEEVNMAKIDACFEKSDEESQNAFKHLERGEANIDLLLQASGNASRSHGSPGQFPFETDMACYSFGINNVIGRSDKHDEDSMDLDCWAEKMKVWTAGFMDSARRKVEKKQLSNSVLQKKIQDQNQMIQQYELKLQNERQKKHHYAAMLQKERQQKQAGDHRYNRELNLMQGVLEDYRMALKQTNSSFAKYRELIQLPKEPLYMPHPDGGGSVILVSEWKKVEKEKQKMAIKGMVEDFEAEWKGNIEKQLGVMDMYCERLEGLGYDVEKISGSF